MDSAALTRYTELLQSADVETRKQAILALGRSKHPAALRPLADVYRSETNAELRDLALRAGQFIRAQAASAAPPPPAAPATPAARPFIEEEPEPEPAPPPRVELPHKVVKPHAAKASRQYLEDALTMQSTGDLKSAIARLKKALDINPNLATDQYFVNVTASILGTSEDYALATLLDRTQTGALVKSADQGKKQKQVSEHLKEVRTITWTSVSLDLMFYSLIMVVGPVLMVLIIGQSFETLRANAIAAEIPFDPSAWGELSAYVGVVDPPTLLAIGGSALLSGLASLLLQAGIIHFTSSKLLGGKGTFRYLLYKLISYYNRFLIITFVISYLAFYLAIGQGMPLLMVIAGGILGLYSLVALLKLAARIGEAYHFSTGMGCVSLILASVLLVVLNGIVAWAASSAFTASLERMLNAG